MSWCLLPYKSDKIGYRREITNIVNIMIKIKRVYEGLNKQDGYRILIDRLWPRGLSNEKVKVALWLKDIALSDKLRKRFSHDIEKWPKFQKMYMLELKDKPGLIDKIKKLEKENKTVTLLFSSKDTLHNNAVVLKDYLKK